MRLFAVFRDLRELIAAVRHLGSTVEALSAFLGDLVETQEKAGPALDRIAALELSRHHFEAEIEGMLLKADGKLKAANNAEARERQLKRSYERLADPFDEGGARPEAAPRDAVVADDAQAREEERLQALRLVVERNPKALAQKAKWGP